MNSIFGVMIYCLRSRYHGSPVCLVAQFFLGKSSPHISGFLSRNHSLGLFCFWFLHLLYLCSVWSREKFSDMFFNRFVVFSVKRRTIQFQRL